MVLAVGVKDIDNVYGTDVATNIKNLVDTIFKVYPDVKVTLSEITPPNDERDGEV